MVKLKHPLSGALIGLLVLAAPLSLYGAQPLDSCPQACKASGCENQQTAFNCYTHCPKDIGMTCIKHFATSSLELPKKLNTSNPGKLKEFQRLFAHHQHPITNTTIDLEEVDSDALTVIVQKASAVNGPQGGILVEDTSLEVAGEDVGVNVRWLLSNLDQYAGKPATWTVMLAFRVNDLIFVSQGVIKGTLVKSRGDEGFGFDPFFLPKGLNKTLAQDKPDSVNARALAVDAMMNKDFFAIVPAIDQWDGPWQSSDDE